MRTEQTNSQHLNLVGNSRTADREIFNSTLRRWQQRFGYWSVLAAVPAVVVSQLQVMRAVEAKQPDAKVTGQDRRNAAKLKTGLTNRSLLKRQSAFVLPGQKKTGDVTPQSGADECPGRAIAAGTYTAAVPYIDSGNTTGANNTVTSLMTNYFYYYYYNDAWGPDHVYSFTLTAHGPNAQIEVSTTSSTYKPMIYILTGGDACPANTNRISFPWSVTDTRWYEGSTSATLHIEALPLNIPLHLFVDSAQNDERGSGPYTIRMTDVTVGPARSPNDIDETQYFVRQHYRDFLNREPDPEGLAFWMNEITSCGGDQQCIDIKRINDSGAFFLSTEFQETGYLVYRMYKAAFGDLPNTPVPLKFEEFLPDTQRVGKGVVAKQAGWEQVLENNKRNFLLEFGQRARFTSAFSPTMSAAEFVDKLNSNAGNPLSSTERDQLVSDLSGGRRSRTDVLRAIAENPKLAQAEFNRAFVLMQYFGYLRRNPNDSPDGNFGGYNFWLEKLNKFNGDFIAAEMVKAFLLSPEYRRRFGP